jgi:hypothetical protein
LLLVRPFIPAHREQIEAIEMPLYEPARHEALTGAPWDENRARAEIESIVRATEQSFDQDKLWPVHPLDRSPEGCDSVKLLYRGAAGVIWTLDHLARTGAVKLKRDYLPVVRDLSERHRDDIRKYHGFGGELSSFMLGELIRGQDSAEAPNHWHPLLLRRPRIQIVTGSISFHPACFWCWRAAACRQKYRVRLASAAAQVNELVEARQGTYTARG